MSYCVYLKKRRLLPVDDVADRIVSLTGLTRADGQQMVRRCRGFLIEHLDPEPARRLTEELGAMGIEAECRQLRELVPNPPVTPVRAGDFARDACVIQDWKSQQMNLVWEDVYLLSVTRLKELELPENIRKKFKTRPLEAPLDAEGREPPEKVRFLLDFFTREPRQHFRVLSTEFRYDYLGARMGDSSTGNFRLMLEDVAGRSLQARQDEGCVASLQGRVDEIPTFTAAYEVDEYHRWLLQTVSAEYHAGAEPARSTYSG